MSEGRNFSKIAPNIAFPEFNFYELYYSTFEKSELDRIKKLLPLREMAENFGLVRKSMRSKLGRRSFFTPEWKASQQDSESQQAIFETDSEGQGSEDRRVRSEGQQHIGRRDIVH